MGLDLLIATAVDGLVAFSAHLVIGVHLIDAGLVVSRVEVIEGFEDGVLAAEDPALDEVWEGLGQLVVHVGASGHGEDVVQLFEGALFGLGHPQEDHDESDDVCSGVETEDTLGLC